MLTGIFVESAMSMQDRDLMIQNEMDRSMTFLRDMKVYDALSWSAQIGSAHFRKISGNAEESVREI